MRILLIYAENVSNEILITLIFTVSEEGHSANGSVRRNVERTVTTQATGKCRIYFTIYQNIDRLFIILTVSSVINNFAHAKGTRTRIPLIQEVKEEPADDSE